ncbi:MAG: D-2-hydroxyacid dehydrogenase family protein [Hyphomicrobiaceae bacterium]
MKIVVLDDYQGVALKLADWSRIRAEHDVIALREHIGEEDELVLRLADADVVCIMRERTPIMAPLIARLPKLKLIVTTGGKHASLDVAAAAERNITVCSTSSSRYATSELTFALVLALARRVVEQHNSVRSGGWQFGLGEDLHGKTLGVIGLGNLGSKVAALGRAFGMRTIAWSQNLTDEQAKAADCRRVSKDELFATADFITVHYKLSPRSTGLVGAADIARMKPTAFLINTSRGPLVDENALIAALLAGRIAGAGLDVFDHEPLSEDHPLRTCPRVVLTPHVGYASRENYQTYFREMVEDIEAWLAGKPVRVVKP